MITSIVNNMVALNAQRQFNLVGLKKSKSAEKLSSGYKINRAADDAAGLAISEKMRRQIRGLNQARDNIQDGVSYCNVAEGALDQVSDMINRIEELSVQSANGTNSSQDREYINQEAQQLCDEMERIFKTTEFNEKKIWPPMISPNVGGNCRDYSLYEIKDGSTTFFGGISYMNHRYSWADLGIGWNDETHTFTQNAVYEISGDVLFKGGNGSADYYNSEDNTAIFTIKTDPKKSVAELHKSYSWSADDEGIRIDGVLVNPKSADNKDIATGDTTWSKMGITPGQTMKSGMDYTFNYYGMIVSFEVPYDMNWDEFKDAFNNNTVIYDWHSDYLSTVAQPNDTMSLINNRIHIDKEDKDNIKKAGYGIYADKTQMGIDGAADSYKKWNEIPNNGFAGNNKYNIQSWGEDANYNGADKTDTIGTGGTDNQAAKVSTFDGSATYQYETKYLKSLEIGFKISNEAASDNVIADIDGSRIGVRETVSPTMVANTPNGKIVSGSSNISFFTQRDELGRKYESDNESIGNGVISRDSSSISNAYKTTINGYTMYTDKTTPETLLNKIYSSCESITKNIYKEYNDEISARGNGVSDEEKKSVLNRIKDQYKDQSVLGKTNMFFSNGGNSISLEIDLSDLSYSDVVDFSALNPENAKSDIGKSIDKDKIVTELDNTLAGISYSLYGDGASYQDVFLQSNPSYGNKIIATPEITGIKHNVSIQAGAEANQTIDIIYDHMRLGTIGLKGISLLTPEDSYLAIELTKRAQQKVIKERSDFGAYTNRLEHAYRINDNTAENTTFAESAIRDTDMAKEMVEFENVKILEQAANSILAQANQSKQGILSLLS